MLLHLLFHLYLYYKIYILIKFYSLLNILKAASCYFIIICVLILHIFIIWIYIIYGSYFGQEKEKAFLVFISIYLFSERFINSCLKSIVLLYFNKQALFKHLLINLDRYYIASFFILLFYKLKFILFNF